MRVFFSWKEGNFIVKSGFFPGQRKEFIRMMVEKYEEFCWIWEISKRAGRQGNSFCKYGRLFPIGSMYGIFTYIYHKNQPNVGKYTIPYGFA